MTSSFFDNTCHWMNSNHYTMGVIAERSEATNLDDGSPILS